MRRLLRSVAELLCPLAIVAIGCDAWRTNVVHEFRGRDIQIYAAVAHFWEQGLIPYRDIYDFKPPFIYVLMRLGFALWGVGAQGLYHLAVIACTLGALGMYGGLRAARLPIAALVSSLALCTLFIASPMTHAHPNTELFAAAFAAVAFGCAAAQFRYSWLAALAGVAYGLATLCKQPAVLLGVPLLVQIGLSESEDRSWRRVLRQIALFACGFGVIIGVTVAYFAWHGAAWAMYHVVIIDGLRYTVRAEQRHDWPFLLQLPYLLTRQSLRVLGEVALSWGSPFTAALVLLALCTLRQPRNRLVLVAWAWLLTSYVAVVIGPLEPLRYLIMGFPALAYSMGVVCEISLRRFRYGWLLALLVSGAALSNLWQVYYLPRSYPGPEPAESETEVIGKAIRAAAQPGDTLFMDELPFDLYVYAGLPPAARILYWDAPTRDAFPNRKRAVDAKPRFIGLQPGVLQAIRAGRSEVYDAQQFEADYEEWLHTPSLLIFRRR